MFKEQMSQNTSQQKHTKTMQQTIDTFSWMHKAKTDTNLERASPSPVPLLGPWVLEN